MTQMRLIRATGALLESLLDDRCPLWGDGLTRKGYGQWNIAQERTDWGSRHLRAWRWWMAAAYWPRRNATTSRCG